MDAIELLNAFDIIKNESLYSQRLQTIADAQTQLNTSKYIVETVEIAQARLDEANRLLEKHRVMWDKVSSELEVERTKRLEDILEKEIKLQQKLNEVVKQEAVVEASFDKLRKEQAELIKTQKSLDIHKSESEQVQKEARKQQEFYESKLEQLRQLIGR